MNNVEITADESADADKAPVKRTDNEQDKRGRADRTHAFHGIKEKRNKMKRNHDTY
jgi:hypothetical protein